MSKTILMCVNHDVVIYNFRKELVEALIEQGYEVIISSPEGPRLSKLIAMGAKIELLQHMKRHSKNPWREYQLYRHYLKLIKKCRPKAVLTYTIKPNLYAGLAAKKLKIPYLVNVTGLSSAITSHSLASRFIRYLSKKSFHQAQTVFMQNEHDRKTLEGLGLLNDNGILLPGSGVNLTQFKILAYPKSQNLEAVFISRIMKKKGFEEYLALAKHVKKTHPKAIFHVCGFVDGPYASVVKQAHDEGILHYHGLLDDVIPILQRSHVLIHPSYYTEGISNVLLEAAASARPIITTEHPGCKETVIDGVSGYLVKVKSKEGLIEAYQKLGALSHEERIFMGLAGRKHVEMKFDRSFVVNRYLDKLKRL